MLSSSLKDLSRDELIGLVLLLEVSALRERVSALEAENAALREDNTSQRAEGTSEVEAVGHGEGDEAGQGKRQAEDAGASPISDDQRRAQAFNERAGGLTVQRV